MKLAHKQRQPSHLRIPSTLSLGPPVKTNSYPKICQSSTQEGTGPRPLLSSLGGGILLGSLWCTSKLQQCTNPLFGSTLRGSHHQNNTIIQQSRTPDYSHVKSPSAVPTAVLGQRWAFQSPWVCFGTPKRCRWLPSEKTLLCPSRGPVLWPFQDRGLEASLVVLSRTISQVL